MRRRGSAWKAGRGGRRESEQMMMMKLQLQEMHKLHTMVDTVRWNDDNISLCAVAEGGHVALAPSFCAGNTLGELWSEFKAADGELCAGRPRPAAPRKSEVYLQEI